jgi:hypothetical protein
MVKPFNALVEVYSVEPSKVVLRTPPRRYPGIVIQGDDLSGLRALAEAACQCLRESDLPRLMDVVQLAHELEELDEHYKAVLRLQVPAKIALGVADARLDR